MRAKLVIITPEALSMALRAFGLIPHDGEVTAVSASRDMKELRAKVESRQYPEVGQGAVLEVSHRVLAVDWDKVAQL